MVPLRSAHKPIPYEDSKRMCQLNSNQIKSIVITVESCNNNNNNNNSTNNNNNNNNLLSSGDDFMAAYGDENCAILPLFLCFVVFTRRSF